MGLKGKGNITPLNVFGVGRPLPPRWLAWLLLAAPGCFWQLLAASGCFWLLLAAPGCSWLLLAAPGCSWLLPRTHLSQTNGYGKYEFKITDYVGPWVRDWRGLAVTTGLLLLLLLLLYVHCFVGFSISRKAISMIRSILYRNGFRMLGHFKHVLKISLNLHHTLNLHAPEGQLGSPRGPFITLYTFMSCHVSVIHKYNNMNYQKEIILMTLRLFE